MELWNLLTSAKIQDFITKALSKRMNALQVSTQLHKDGYSNEERAAIMDYMALVPKFREKFGTDKFFLCDKLALEQSTAQDIGRWKANLWPGEGVVHDLCCGMGGDSFFLPATLKITGIDLDENRLAMFRYNMAAFEKDAGTVCGDVREVANKKDADFPIVLVLIKGIAKHRVTDKYNGKSPCPNGPGTLRLLVLVT